MKLPPQQKDDPLRLKKPSLARMANVGLFKASFQTSGCPLRRALREGMGHPPELLSVAEGPMRRVPGHETAFSRIFADFQIEIQTKKHSH
jgi:hypothetical protein